MSYDVRAAEPGDLPLLAAIEASGDRLAEQALGTDERFPEPSTGQWRARQPGFLLVAGRPAVGFAHVLEEDGVAHLEQLVVRPDHGRRGIGSALVEACCTRASADGYDALSLTTYAELPFNRPLYERLGFVVVAEPTGVLARHVEHERPYERFGPRVGMARTLH